MMALDFGASLLPGHSDDEILGIAYEAIRCYGKLTVETFKAAAETTLTNDRQNSNPHPGRIPRGGEFTYDAIGGGSPATNKNRVAVFH